jgi:hypothetical protein
VYPTWLPVFFLFFYNERDARIDPGMALTPFSSSILDETIFERTTFQWGGFYLLIANFFAT